MPSRSPSTHRESWAALSFRYGKLYTVYVVVLRGTIGCDDAACEIKTPTEAPLAAWS